MKMYLKSNIKYNDTNKDPLELNIIAKYLSIITKKHNTQR